MLGHQLVERGGGRQRTGEVPGAAGVGQHAPLASAAHELGEHLQVAAREPGELGAGRRRHRTVEGAVEQGAELVGIERSDLHAHEVPVAVEDGETGRRRATGAHRPDQEHRPRHDEGNEDGDRRVVEQVEVVDEEHEPVVTGQPPQLGPGGVEQTGALVVADAELGSSGRRGAGGRARRAGSPVVAG